MKYLRILGFLSLFIAFNTTACSHSVENSIEGLNIEVAAINSDTTLEKVELENEEFLEYMTDGGGKLTGFFRDGTIRKIQRWVGLSNGNEIMEYYFNEGHLIFVYEEFNSFVYDNQTEQFNLTETDKTFIGRYYFNNQKLIDYISTGHNRFEDDSIGPEKTLLTEAKNYLNLLSRKK